MSETTVSDQSRDDDERPRDASRRTSHEDPSSVSGYDESGFLHIEIRDLDLPLSSIGKLKVLASGTRSLYVLLVLLVVILTVVAVLWNNGVIP